MKAKIKSKKEVAKETLLVEFDLLGEQVNFKAGQFFFVKLINPPFKDERGDRRHFTIVNSPNQNRILSFTTRLRNSGFKKSIKELPVGTEVDVSLILGDFILPKDLNRPLVFIAGGIGITPFRSMFFFIKEESLPFKITLIYSNRNISSTPFLKELENLSNQNKNFKFILTMTKDQNWKDEKRRIDENFIKDYIINPKSSIYYIAGPPNFVEAVFKSLIKIGIHQKDIKKEEFTGY